MNPILKLLRWWHRIQAKRARESSSYWLQRAEQDLADGDTVAYMISMKFSDGAMSSALQHELKAQQLSARIGKH